MRLIFSFCCLPSRLRVALIRHLYSIDPASDPVDSSRAFAPPPEPDAAADDAPAAVVGFPPLPPFAPPAFPFAGGDFALGLGVGAVLPSSEKHARLS